jgi:hypothetical protein
MRDGVYDKFKSTRQLRADHGKTCSIPGCDHLLTAFRGPGSDCLCRAHQLAQTEYGGLGKIARPHTFHRNSDFSCDECGWHILDDPRLAGIADEMDKRQVARILLHGDHNKTRRADGGDDTAANIKSLCVICHAKKTVLNRDNRKGHKDGT